MLCLFRVRYNMGVEDDEKGINLGNRMKEVAIFGGGGYNITISHLMLLSGPNRQPNTRCREYWGQNVFQKVLYPVNGEYPPSYPPKQPRPLV